MDHDFGLRAGNIIIPGINDYLSPDQQHGQHNPQKIHHAEALLSNQRHVRHHERNGEDQEKRECDKHICFCRSQKPRQNIASNAVLRHPCKIKIQRQIGQGNKERKKGKTEVDDRIIGIQVIADLQKESANQQHCHKHEKQ